MKLDLTVIRNESINKFEKAVSRVNKSFKDMLWLTLDGCVYEIDPDKRLEIEQVVANVLHDEFAAIQTLYVKCMNKAQSLVENGLST